MLAYSVVVVVTVVVVTVAKRCISTKPHDHSTGKENEREREREREKMRLGYIYWGFFWGSQLQYDKGDAILLGKWGRGGEGERGE